MEAIRQWIFGIAACSVTGTIALAVTPAGPVKRVLRVGISLLLAIAVLKPFTGWNGEIIWEAGWNEIDLQGAGQDILCTIIEERTAAYIISEAQAIGLVVSVTVECRQGEYYPEPWIVTLRSRTPEHAMNALSGMIERDIGVPPERQKYYLGT